MPEVESLLVHPNLDRWLILPIARLFFGILLFLLGPLRVGGKRHIPRTGGLLILANHQSDIDPIAIQLACPRAIRFMAKSELFEIKSIAWIMRGHGAFPVKRGEPDRTALKHAAALLNAGEVVCIFPEGQLSEDGKLQELKPGVALIVRMADVPVICCGVNLTRKIIPYGSVLPRPAFRRVSITWGRHRTFREKVAAEEILQWATHDLLRLSGEIR